MHALRSGLVSSSVLLVFLIGCGSSDSGGPGTSGSTGGASSSSGGSSAAGGTSAGGSGGVIVGSTGGTAPTGGTASVGTGGVLLGSGGSTGTAAGGTGGAGTDTCSPYVDDAPTITRTMQPGASPTMTGGTIADGKYWLISANRPGGTTLTLAERIDVSRGGTYFDDVARENGSELRNGTTVAVSGTTATFTIVCGLYKGTTGMGQYSATPSQLTILQQSGEVKVYAKQ